MTLSGIIVLVLIVGFVWLLSRDGKRSVRTPESSIPLDRLYNDSRAIEAGRFVGGHPQTAIPVSSVRLVPQRDNLVLVSLDINLLPAWIPRRRIMDVVVEEFSSTRERAMLGPTLVLGVIGYALKETEEYSGHLVYIVWSDDDAVHATAFEFEGEHSLSRATATADAVRAFAKGRRQTDPS